MAVGNSKLLFDSGPGTMRRLLEANTAICEISHIFYSHFHPDHSGEFVPFLFATKYPVNRQRKEPLTVTGGTGLLDFYDRLKHVYGHWIELDPDLLTLMELDHQRPDSTQFRDFRVESAPMAHNEESIAFRITSPEGASAVYSGDTDYTENLIELARDADLLICESAMPDKMRVKGHLTPSLAGEIATRSGVKKLVLTHFYPECDQVNIEKQCRKTYDGPLVLAEDLMRIKVRRNS
jgi:ribonuclease BN (tRNA processing enzyme)